MIPYREIPPLELFGPFKIYPFGVLVGLAVLLGSTLAGRRAEAIGIQKKRLEDLILRTVIGGFIGAHLYSAIFYFPAKIQANPLYLLKIWEDISSFGGFIGGSIAVAVTLRGEKRVWEYADCLCVGLVFAWIFGRLGCTVAFDHPGSPTDFFMGMPYPARDNDISPVVRHNLGFYEVFWAMAMSLFLWTQRSKARRPGWFLYVTVICYVPFRFALDFLRAEDRRYLGMTPAQYAAIGVLLVAVFLFWRRRHEPELAHAPAPAAKKQKKHKK